MEFTNQQWNNIIETLFITNTKEAGNKVKLVYYDNKTGDLKEPHFFLEEELKSRTPCLLGSLFVEGFYLKIEPLYRESSDYMLNFEQGSFLRRLFYKTKHFSLKMKKNYSELMGHTVYIEGKGIRSRSMIINGTTSKNLVDYYKENYSEIVNANFLNDTKLNESDFLTLINQ